MDIDLLLVFLFSTTVILLVCGSIVLFPISRRLGHFLEQRLHERDRFRLRTAEEELLGAALERLESKLDSVMERQEFVEALVNQRSRPALRTVDSDRGHASDTES